MKRLFSIIALGIALIIALSLAFYFVIFLPNKEKVGQELKQQELELEKQKFESQETIELKKLETPTPKPKTSYDKCVEACTKRYTEGKDGCNPSQRRIYSLAYARFMCQMTKPACETECSQPNK